MKKILLALTFISGAIIANAQTEKGDWMVGGGFQLNTSENDTRIALSPNAGLFVISNLAIGCNLLFDYSKNGDNKRTDFGIGPFVRYYFTKTNIRRILQGSFNFLSSRNKTPLTSNTENGTSYFLGGGHRCFY